MQLSAVNLGPTPATHVMQHYIIGSDAYLECASDRAGNIAAIRAELCRRHGAFEGYVMQQGTAQLIDEHSTPCLIDCQQKLPIWAHTECTNLSKGTAALGHALGS